MIDLRFVLTGVAAAGIGAALLFASSVAYQQIAEPARATIAELALASEPDAKRIVTVSVSLTLRRRSSMSSSTPMSNAGRPS
jgi:hypothetical protein